MPSIRSLLSGITGLSAALVGAPQDRRCTTRVLLLAALVLLVGQPALGQSKVYWVTNSNATIMEAELDGSNSATVYEGMPAPNGMDVDAASGKIYWVDAILGKIFRANTDGTSQEELVSGLAGPSDVALDLVNSKMYWTDLNGGEIGRADLDGSNVETQLTGLSGPVAIAVDGAVGKFYWTDTVDGKVQRADLDGSNIEDLRINMFGGVSAIGLDLTNSKVYWIDGFGQIDRANLDGSAYENLIFDVGDFMAVDAVGGKIYWTDQSGQRLVRANLDGTGAVDIVTGLVGPIGIGLDLTNSKVYWIEPTASDKVQRANLDGSSSEAIVTPEVVSVGDLAVAGGKIYWTDNGTGKVRRANVDFTSPEDLVIGQTTPVGIQVDEAGGKMYWIDQGTTKIQRADLDGSNSEDLVTGLTTPRHLDLDVSGGKMYWTDGTEIRSANLDGTSNAAVVTGLTSPLGVAVGSLYWVDNDKIQSAANDGSGQTNLVTGLFSPHGVALDAAAGKVYYIDTGAPSLRRVNTDGSNDEFLLSAGFGATDLALSIETSLTESTAAAGLFGAAPAVASDEVQIFAIGITGDGTSSVNSIDITLSDLTAATGLAAADFAELRLYTSTDAILDGGDTQIGNEPTINIGSATTITAGTPDVPGNGTEVFYLISAVVASGPTGGHVFRVGFAANGVITSGTPLGTAVAAADANSVTILRLTESTTAAGLSGASTAAANDEVQVYSIGITGDGVSAVFGVDITLSDLTAATGLAAADIAELRLYSSTDATLDGGDTQIGNETSINIGSATTIAAGTPDVPGSATQVFYIVSAVVASSPTGGHALRVGFAANGVTTSLGFLGTTVSAVDANNITILGLAETTVAAGLSGVSTADADDEAQVYSIGITGDGTSSVNSIDITLSDLTAATGLAAADFAELRLYTSTDAILDGGDTQIGNETTINIGSATTIAAGTPHVPGSATQVFYLISAVVSSSPTDGHAFRVGFAATGVATSGDPLGTAVSAADANYVTIGTKIQAAVTLSGLSFTYNGDARSVTAATVPTGLNVIVTYDGSANPPVGPGDFSVVAVINDPTYEGTVTGTLNIANPPAPVIDLRTSAVVGLAPLRVTFTDSSTGFITQRVLELADDETTVVIDPEGPVTVTYSQAGTHEAVVFIRAIGGRGEQRIPIAVYELPAIAEQTIDQGQSVTVALLPPSVAEVLELTVEPELSGASLENGEWRWQPDFEQAGEYSLTATATDGAGTVQTQSFTIVVNEVPPPVIRPDPVALGFGNVLAGRSAERSFGLSNPTDVPLVLSGFEIDSPMFAMLSPDLPVTIAPGDLETFFVRFDARRGDQPQATALELTTNLGRVLTPMTGRSLWAALEHDTERLNFGTVLRGESAQLFFIVENPGTVPVRGAISVDERAFVVVPQRFTLEPGMSQEFTVTFSPMRAENHMASLRFVDIEPSVGPALAVDPISVLGFSSPVAFADFNGDRVVDMEDFFAFAAVAFQPLTPENAVFDLSRDGRIDLADMFQFSDTFGEVMPLILARSTQLDPVSKDYLALYGGAIRSIMAGLADGTVSPGDVVGYLQSGRAAELAVDIEVPAELESVQLEIDAATLHGLSAELVTSGSSELPAGLTPLSNTAETRTPDTPVTDGPVGFITSAGDELAVHGNVVTLPRSRARFSFARLRISEEPTLQEEIQRIRASQPELTQETIDVHCSAGRHVSVDKVFSRLYDSGSPGTAVEELYWVLATNSVSYDCETQKYAADFTLQYFCSVRSGAEPVVTEEFIISESLLR